MGIKKKENYGILFHHFHTNDKFYLSPGSLTKKKFNDFISKYKNQIQNPDNFFLESKKKNMFNLRRWIKMSKRYCPTDFKKT